MNLDEQINARLAKLNPAERRLAEIRVARIARRRQALGRFPSPGFLAKFVHPDTVQTKMLAALDRVAVACDTGFQRRWLLSTPPQEGKTQRMAVVTSLWWLLRDPTRRIVVASYEQGLAARSTLAVRQLIETYGGGYKGDRRGGNQEDVFGLLLDPDRALQTNWQLADTPGRRDGGMTAVGVGSGFTGRSADVLIVDDPFRDVKQADSPQQRKAVHDWFRAVATTRLSPGAVVVVIQTRWHEDDLMGRLLRDDDLEPTPRWGRLFIPAQAGADDPLGREPGEFLASARGRTVEDWTAIRRDVGERFWAALYQGRPAPPEGGVFQASWIENHRTRTHPELARVEVFVDPADNEGDGDEAGIIAAARGYDGRYYVLADDSGHMTVGTWLRRALLLGLRLGATSIRYERSLSGLNRQARQAWRDLVREARKLHELWTAKSLPGQSWPNAPAPKLLAAAVNALARDDATAEERVTLEAALLTLWPLVPAALAVPAETGIPVRPLTATGSKTTRAQLIAPLFEGGHVSYVGHFPDLEHQQITWQEGQDSPDRMDALVHALTELSRAGAFTMSGASGAVPTRSSAATIGRGAPTRW